MNPSERTLALALVLGAYFSHTGNRHTRPNHLFERTQIQATHLAAQFENRFEKKTANLLTICTARFCTCDGLPGTLERLGVPTELVRESA
jgi:hypothetical protein